MSTGAPIKRISSRDNEVFGVLAACLEPKGIRKHGYFHVFGRRAVHDTLASHGALARNLILGAGLHTADDALAKIAGEKATGQFSLIELSKPLFDELDLFGTKTPILFLQAPEFPAADLTKAPQGLEVLCALSDPSNVGALLRSAAAFGASKIILLQESASPLHPRAVRSASAATLITPLERGPSIRALGEIRGPIAALDMHGEDLNRFQWPRDTRLLLGEEGLGVPEDLPDARLIRIPMQKGVESLNATVAASIALYSYRAQIHD